MLLEVHVVLNGIGFLINHIWQIFYFNYQMRATSVDAFYSKNGNWYIVVSPSLSALTYIVTIDCTTGNPLYTGIPFVDVFPDHSIAVETIVESGAQLRTHGEGFLGLIQTEFHTIFAIIDKTQTRGELPPNHKVKTIKHTTFITIPIKANATQHSPFEDFQINNNHYFCDSYDLTRLFPCKDNNNPDYSFVWNNGWRKPFEILGIPQICTNIIQGLCVSKTFIKFGITIAYICRRSVLNPGTRYAARGLNDLNSPGNEVECELLFFKGNDFWTERWRRGSIPIRWKTTLSSKIASPKHTVDKDYFRGTCEYFRDLTNRYGIGTMIRCVSLLNSESEHAESELKNFFKEALNRLFDNGIDNVYLVPFDLNHHLHEDGSGEAMMDFLSFISPLCEGDGFTYGTLPCTITESQKGIMRFNCADSLDRTNLATFYYAMKCCKDFLKMIHTGLTSTPDADPNQPNLIIDQSVIDFLAEVFVDCGNIISQLYTNTPAIKTNAIKRFSPSIVVGSSDTNISMQRRLQNVVNDPIRQKLIEMWTNPGPLSWYHRIDYRHIFIVPNEKQDPLSDMDQNNVVYQFPQTVFSPNIRAIDSKSKELLICLPAPMIFYSFMILLYPTNQNLNGISLTGGMDMAHMRPITDLTLPSVEQAIWLRYRPVNACRWGLEKAPKFYVRFLSFNFDCPDPTFSIGNIRIEGKSIFSGESETAMTTHEERNMKASQEIPKMPSSQSTPLLSKITGLNKYRDDYYTSEMGSGSLSMLTLNCDSESLDKSILAHQMISDNISDDVSEATNQNEAIVAGVDENDEKINPTSLKLQENCERYKHSFQKFVRSARNLRDVLELEKIRVGLGLHEDIRIQLALENGISPWIADSRARLTTLTLHQCGFCRMSHQDSMFYYFPSPIFPGLIKRSKFHEKGGFPVCPICNEIAENIANITEAYEANITHIMSYEHNETPNQSSNSSQNQSDAPKSTENELPNFSELQTQNDISNSNEKQHNDDLQRSKLPHFSILPVDEDLCLHSRAETTESNSAFMNMQSSLLWDKNGSEFLIKGENRFYELFIVQLAVIVKLTITISNSIDVAPFEVFDEEGNPLKMDDVTHKEENTTSFDFHFAVQPITKRLKFSIKALDNVELRKLKALYIIMKESPEDVQVHKKEQLKMPSLSNSIPYFDNSSRTETLKLDKVSKITLMQVEMLVEKGSTTPLSLFIALYKSNEMIANRHIILPEVTNGTKLWYVIDKEGILADTIKLFYADRFVSIRPHTIRFVIQQI